MTAFEHPTERRLHGDWRAWFADTALPFWRRHGWRATSPLALERLYFDGTPDVAAPLRVRTQARQIYTFAHAALLHVDTAGADFVRPNLEALARHALGPDGGSGWVHVLNPDGTVADGRRDLYDHAFLLLMLGYARATEMAPEAGTWLEQTFTALDTIFQATHGGYAETAMGGLPRRQNPHMHLFEAMLALFELTGDVRFLAKAGELFGLWRSRWFDEASGSLREFFAHDWSPLPDGGSDVLEPGHHMEWVWLLRRYERLSGRPVGNLADALFARGEALGLRSDSDGFIVDETDMTGRLRQDSRRLWSQTEYLKALIVQARAHERADLYARALSVSERMFATYLADVPAGAWRDRFTVAGVLAVDHVPASTLYHLFGVLAELEVAHDQQAAVS